MRLHITAEGQTEQFFVNNTLKNHLSGFGIYADVRCVLTSSHKNKSYRGGLTSYPKAKNDILKWVREESNNQDVFFTTMFDYYALPNDFPKFTEAKSINDPYRQVEYLENAFYEDIGCPNFIPYIQLYEFETLLFADPSKFTLEYFDLPKKVAQITSIISTFPNIELIDGGESTSPSKRIIDIFPDYAYSKAAVGSSIAHEIGVDCLKKSCKHFCDWVSALEKLDIY